MGPACYRSAKVGRAQPTHGYYDTGRLGAVTSETSEKVVRISFNYAKGTTFALLYLTKLCLREWWSQAGRIVDVCVPFLTRVNEGVCVDVSTVPDGDIPSVWHRPRGRVILLQHDGVVMIVRGKTKMPGESM